MKTIKIIDGKLLLEGKKIDPLDFKCPCCGNKMDMIKCSRRDSIKRTKDGPVNVYWYFRYKCEKCNYRIEIDAVS